MKTIEKQNNPNPATAIFSIKDRTGNKYTLVAQQLTSGMRYYKVGGWNGTSGTGFNIDRMRAKFPKIKIDVKKIAAVIEADLKGYSIHFYETV